MPKVESETTYKGRKNVASSVDALATKEKLPQNRREKPTPNYLKPTISFSSQHCNYPKHQQTSRTPAAPTPTLKQTKKLNFRTQRSKPSTKVSIPPSKNANSSTTKAAPQSKSTLKESATVEEEEKVVSNDLHNTSRDKSYCVEEEQKGIQVFRREPKEYDGRSDLSEENKEVKSEHYWGSEESMAGEESAGEGSIAHSRMIYAPGEKDSTAVPEMKKAEINQRKQGLASGGGAQEGNASKVKTRVGAFESLFSLEETTTSVGEQAAGFSTKKGDAIKYLINNREEETHGGEEKQGDNESS